MSGKRVLLAASTTGYQIREFASAAEKVSVELVLASDRCHVLEDPWGDHAIPVRFDGLSDGLEAGGLQAEGLDAIEARGPFDGIVAVGDRPAYFASLAAKRLGLRFSPPFAVLAAKNKFLSRQLFRAAGLPVPDYHPVPSGRLAETAASAKYPCVLKPLGLAGSRGVIRVDNPAEFRSAFARIQRMLKGEREKGVQREDFIPGREFALEGIVTQGSLRVLALFDKPDPLDGPFFEETIYVTPSREPDRIQEAIFATAQRAVHALGLTDGPVHAEMRVNDAGVWMLEMAARPIGGLCSRVLRFEGEASLEDIILRHALGLDFDENPRPPRLASGGHGVMMIPIPRAGVFEGVDGWEQARAVAGVEDIVITAKQGQALAPLPDGASYLGFIFARGGSPASAERSLREAHARLAILLAEILPVVS